MIVLSKNNWFKIYLFVRDKNVCEYESRLGNPSNHKCSEETINMMMNYENCQAEEGQFEGGNLLWNTRFVEIKFVIWTSFVAVKLNVKMYYFALMFSSSHKAISKRL